MPDLSGSKLRQWWRVAFVLGCVMINYPFLHIFDRPAFLFGFPLVYIYFAVGWGASIAVIALYAWSVRERPPEKGG